MDFTKYFRRRKKKVSQPRDRNESKAGLDMSIKICLISENFETIGDQTAKRVKKYCKKRRETKKEMIAINVKS